MEQEELIEELFRENKFLQSKIELLEAKLKDLENKEKIYSQDYDKFK